MLNQIPQEILLKILEYGYEQFPSRLLKTNSDEKSQNQIPMDWRKLFNNVNLFNSLELTCRNIRNVINSDQEFWKESVMHLVANYFVFGSYMDLIRIEIQKLNPNKTISCKRLFAILNMYRKQMRVKPLKKRKQTSKNSESTTRKILMLGTGGVGKSTICFTYTQRTTDNTLFDPTLEDAYKRTISLNGKQVELELIDANFFGCEDYSFSADIKKQTISDVDGIMLVCAVNDKNSLQYCGDELDFILSAKNFLVNIPISFVIHKIDLVNIHMDYQEVTIIESKEILESKGFVNYSIFETSAMQFNLNIDEAFEDLAKKCDRITKVDTLALVREIIKKDSKVLIDDFKDDEKSPSSSRRKIIKKESDEKSPSSCRIM